MAKPRSLIRVFIGVLPLFGLAACFLYMAYIGMKTKTGITPDIISARHPGIHKGGVISESQNPTLFWTDEIFFSFLGVSFAAWGSKNLFEEYKNRHLSN